MFLLGTSRLIVIALALSSAAIAACGGSGKTPESAGQRAPKTVDVELPQLELNADGVDRFATCPPSGAVTQGWIPRIPIWTAPASAGPAVDAGVNAAAFASVAEIAVGARRDEPTNAPSQAEMAIRDTLQPFRTCHRRGLLHDATQEGHVAIVVRIGPDGRVAKAESYGACELSREVVLCMLQVGKRLRFEPPTGDNNTIVIPAAFAPRAGITRRSPGHHDDYAAAASIVVEGARPDLHRCDEREGRAMRSREAWGTFVIEVDEQGKPYRQNIEPWSGNQELLRCATEAVGRLAFPPPPGGTATVRVRLAFNARSVVSE